MPPTPTCLCGECKKCKHRDYMRAWYQSKSSEERRAWVELRDPDVVRENDRRRYRRDKPKRNAAMTTYRAEVDDPVKVAARAAVNRALRAGKLIKQPCQDCGDPRSHAHHPDYEYPLWVEWLCALDHAKRHPKDKISDAPATVPVAA